MKIHPAQQRKRKTHLELVIHGKEEHLHKDDVEEKGVTDRSHLPASLLDLQKEPTDHLQEPEYTRLRNRPQRLLLSESSTTFLPRGMARIQIIK